VLSGGTGLDPPSESSIYAFYKLFYETGSLCKGKVFFTAKCVVGIVIQT
jgi:hypothetical protein